MQLYDVELVAPEDLGYSPESIVDVLKKQSFLQTSIRLHSGLAGDVLMGAPQLKAIVLDLLNSELSPGKYKVAGRCSSFLFFGVFSVNCLRFEARRQVIGIDPYPIF